jgi:hypothetical protein
MESHSQSDERKSTTFGVWLLEFFVPSDSVRNLIGDLKEEYRRTVEGEPAVARLEFWGQVISAAGFYFKEFCELRRQSIAHSTVRMLSIAILILFTLGPFGSERKIHDLALVLGSVTVDLEQIKTPLARVKTKPYKPTPRTLQNTSQDYTSVSTGLAQPKSTDTSVRSSGGGGVSEILCRDLRRDLYFVATTYDDGSYYTERLTSSEVLSRFPHMKDVPKCA